MFIDTLHSFFLEARAAPYSLFDGREGWLVERTATGIHDTSDIHRQSVNARVNPFNFEEHLLHFFFQAIRGLLLHRIV